MGEGGGDQISCRSSRNGHVTQHQQPIRTYRMRNFSENELNQKWKYNEQLSPYRNHHQQQHSVHDRHLHRRYHREVTRSGQFQIDRGRAPAAFPE